MKMDIELKNNEATIDLIEMDSPMNIKYEKVIEVGIGKEVDPTVPDWAKQPEKPTYHISEIEGADELGGGGQGVFVVNLEYDGDGGYICHNTFEEVRQAYNEGKLIVGRETVDGKFLTTMSCNPDYGYVRFAMETTDSTTILDFVESDEGDFVYVDWYEKVSESYVYDKINSHDGSTVAHQDIRRELKKKATMDEVEEAIEKAIGEGTGGGVAIDDTLTIEGAAADAKAVGDALQATYMKLNSNKTLGFYCVEDVTIVTNGVSKTYPANSNVEVSFAEGDVFEIIPTSDNSILSLTAFPGALGTFYPWLEGVKQFSNILFDMNDVDMYSKWSQGNQGAYQVQYAQYANCIFWSDNPYVSDVSKRTNYTLLYSSQLPLCYSTIPDNTFKAFYLAFGVNSDPNWSNKAYRDSFAKANWATQVFSYYGARTIGIFGHDDPDFNIVLPPDCRGLMCEATAIENAGTFDAINVTNFGAKSGSWRDAFRMCYSLRNLYIKNLKVNLNVSWSPLNYESIYFILSAAANTKKITISVSPYTYNLLKQSDFDLAASKNIVIELLASNYVEDKRLGEIANKADKTYVDEIASRIPSDDHINELISAALSAQS